MAILVIDASRGNLGKSYKYLLRRSIEYKR